MTTTALPPGTPPLGFSREQAAEYCGVGLKLFDELVKAGTLPAPVRLGARRIVWDRRRLVAAFDRLQNLSPILKSPDDADPLLESLNDG